MERPSAPGADRYIRLLRAFALGFALLAATAGAAEDKPQSQEELLANSRRTGKPETRAYLGTGKAAISLAPSEADGEYLRGELARQNPDICVESLSVAEYPPEFAALAPEARALALGNVLRSISALKGIEYYSISRGKRRILFDEAYCVDSPETAARTADPLVGALPAKEERFAVLRDSTFGRNLMRLEYRGGPGSLSLSVENLSAMRLGPVTAVKPNRFEIVLVVADQGDCAALYALALARASALPGMRDKIRESTSNRVDALQEWIRSGLSSPPDAPR